MDPVILKRRFVGVAFRCRFCARDYSLRQDAMVCAEDCRNHQLRLHEAEQSLTEQSDDPAPKKLRGKAAPKCSAVKAVASIRPSPSTNGLKKPARELALPNPISADVLSESEVDGEGPPTDTNTVFDSTVLADSTPASGSPAASGPVSGSTSSDSEMLHGIGTGAYGKKDEEGAVFGVGTGAYGKKGEEDQGKSMDSGPNKLKTSDAFYRDGARYVCNSCNVKYFTRGEVEACFAGHK